MTDRFVILHHLAPSGEHWDLMLECGAVLATWQLMSEPTGRDACPIAARRIQDHRKRYLSYEGPVSGGRGIVSRVDEGSYSPLRIEDGSWTVRLHGRRMSGDFCLTEVEGQNGAWLLGAV